MCFFTDHKLIGVHYVCALSFSASSVLFYTSTLHGMVNGVFIECCGASLASNSVTCSSVVIIMILTSIMCTHSFLRQLIAKHTDQTFRILFYDSLFGKESRVFKSPCPILIVICLLISLWYIVTMVFHIHYDWDLELPLIVHPLQIYPTLCSVLQSTFQGKCLFFLTVNVERQS